MNTPICDFVTEYAASEHLRFHMPGHKGTPLLGPEPMDITEISGADSLYEASGIIRQSEANCSELFGCPTYYSTEGSSQCIRAMLFLCKIYAEVTGKPPIIAAARNVHKVFLSGIALLDMNVCWLYPNKQESYLSCCITPDELEDYLSNTDEKPAAIYVTSPDYLGNMMDLQGLSQVCHRYGVLLVVDNAHGAYLKFLPNSMHPIDCGADLCCSSAHKTLPALTGAAYLHISSRLPVFMQEHAKTALSLFGSTSPSYLILQSLDGLNPYLSKDYPKRLASFCQALKEYKKVLMQHGYSFIGDEPLKLTIAAKKYGYTGTELACILRNQGAEPEFADPDFLVFMLTPETEFTGIRTLVQILQGVPKHPAIDVAPPCPPQSQVVMTPREAMLRASEILPVFLSEGRILASPSVGCPPAVPISICGEVINRQAIECFTYYGVENVRVLIEK